MKRPVFQARHTTTKVLLFCFGLGLLLLPFTPLGSVLFFGVLVGKVLYRGEWYTFAPVTPADRARTASRKRLFNLLLALLVSGVVLAYLVALVVAFTANVP